MKNYLAPETARQMAKVISYFKNKKTVYFPINDHIYYDGKSYRVRVTQDAVRTSKNFKSYSEAIKFRDKLIK